MITVKGGATIEGAGVGRIGDQEGLLLDQDLGGLGVLPVVEWIAGVLTGPVIVHHPPTLKEEEVLPGVDQAHPQNPLVPKSGWIPWCNCLADFQDLQGLQLF